MKNALKIATKIATKNVRSIHAGAKHIGLGDGFPVHTVFSYQDLGADLTPFCFSITPAPPISGRPTRSAASAGIRTAASRPSRSPTRAKSITRTPAATGAASPGRRAVDDRGLGRAAQGNARARLRARGGPSEMLQLWVNLPAKSKMTSPRYQGLLDRDIPAAMLPGDAGSVRVIAGEFEGRRDRRARSRRSTCSTCACAPGIAYASTCARAGPRRSSS